MKIYIKNLASCRARLEKTNQYAQYARAAGHVVVEKLSEADTILLWTCAFREDFKHSSVSKIEEYLSTTSADLIVCGCLIDIDNGVLPHGNNRVAFVQWKNENRDIQKALDTNMDFSNFIKPLAEVKLCDDAAAHRKEHPESAAMFADQFNKLIISAGCNFDCAYCSEKLVFPPYTSHTPAILIAEARQLYELNGVKDFMLMADSLGQYGCDCASSLTRLIDAFRVAVPGARCALNNLNPSSVIEDFENFKRLIAEGAIYHLNLPMQTASDSLCTA